jgi:hypothetical protein
MILSSGMSHYFLLGIRKDLWGEVELNGEEYITYNADERCFAWKLTPDK